MPTEPNKPSEKQNRPGAMTVAMQAVQVKPTGPKVLRVGVIQHGRIVEERVIRKRETVSVGTSEKNHFVVLGDGVPSRFDVFQLVGDDYILNFTEGMSGRIGLPGGVQDLDQMRKSGAARNAGTHFQVKLTDSSRGRVNIGTTTLLFQFVVPPPVQPRPQLPAAARAGFVRSIDWMFTALVVFTFMTMFGFIVYLENADWPLAQDAAEVPPEVARMIFEEPTPPPEVEEEPTESDEPSEEAEAAPQKPAPGPPAEKPAPSEDEAKAQAEATARIAEEAAQAAEALIVGALSAEGGALADVLAGGAVTGNAQDILAQAAGVGVAQSGAGGTLRQRSGGGTGSGQQGLGSLSRAGGAETTAGRGEGTVVKERTIKGNLKLGDGGDIGGAGEFDSNLVIAKIRSRLGGIRACYERELRKNPTLAGKVTIEFAIEERGNVSGVKVAENTTGDTAVGECVANEIKRIPTFNPGPEGGKVVFSYPFVFAPQN
jgi:outer membrane biosynthesis protein TonB